MFNPIAPLLSSSTRLIPFVTLQPHVPFLCAPFSLSTFSLYTATLTYLNSPLKTLDFNPSIPRLDPTQIWS
ncbi:hypothetical protein AKJ16_DCAP12975 [Drosera capensis]